MGIKGSTLPNAKRKTASEGTVIIGPEEKFGPAMSRLTDARKRFVKAAVLCPGRPAHEYAKMAGIGGTQNTQRTEGYRLLKDETVVEAIKEYEHMEFGTEVPMTRLKLVELRDSDNPKVALEACKIILQHAGMVVAGRQDTLTVKHEIEAVPQEELMEALRQIAEANPRPQLTIIDTEYSEVEAA